MHACLKCWVALCHWSVTPCPCTLMIHSISGLLAGNRQKCCPGCLLAALQRPSEAWCLRVQMVGQYHLGDFVNKFRHGSLVMKLPDSDAAKIPTVLFGTINGAIGVLASLPQEQFAFLERLQVLPSSPKQLCSTGSTSPTFKAYEAQRQLLLTTSLTGALHQQRLMAIHGT